MRWSANWTNNPILVKFLPPEAVSLGGGSEVPDVRNVAFLNVRYCNVEVF